MKPNELDIVEFFVRWIGQYVSVNFLVSIDGKVRFSVFHRYKQNETLYGLRKITCVKSSPQEVLKQSNQTYRYIQIILIIAYFFFFSMISTLWQLAHLAQLLAWILDIFAADISVEWFRTSQSHWPLLLTLTLLQQRWCSSSFLSCSPIVWWSNRYHTFEYRIHRTEIYLCDTNSTNWKLLQVLQVID